jgi:hypothetical protein
MSQFSEEEWGQVTDSSGDFARVDQLAGHLLIVFPIGYIDHHPTRFTQPGKKSDVVVCDLVDLDAQDEATGAVGKVYRNAWWRQSQLIVSLRPWIGKRVLGRLGKGISRNGMNAPWILNDAVQEPGAIDRAKQWAAANPGFAISQFSPPTLAPVAPAPAQQAPAYGQAPNYGGPSNAPAQQPGQYQPAPAYAQQGGYQQTPPPPSPDPWANTTAPDPWAQSFPAPQPQQVGPQGYQQPQQVPPNYQPVQPPAFPINGGQQQDPSMLAMMRAERERREAGYQQGQGDQPPF